ncbi:MAG: pseudouridine-5'-phosphate glycosidase [Chloroflexi bacterium]|nr:pseudouridine-5'-phosphate glycosidase [Chloroflexota bacterium]
MSQAFHIAPEISRARELGLPIVALESTVITHGLPQPENLSLAQDMEEVVRAEGAAPATIAVLSGKIHIGLDSVQLEQLSTSSSARKVSVRDFGAVIAKGLDGGTTVAGTLFAAQHAGIRIMATGGIGGVHRQPPYDVSADLTQLARSQVIVVCAGAKAILDLPGTLEVLETLRVPVIGYQTDEFPAFYSRKSGLHVSDSVDYPEQAANIAREHWRLGIPSAILLVVPPPEDIAIPKEKIDTFIDRALVEAQEKHIRGQDITPFLLNRVSELTAGESLQANLGLLKNNARIAAKIAHFIHPQSIIKSA